eukprot:GFUD01099253.1.p1 GENE.GFUD01099253.1~~GFUD01099253.1.p1  ORF type:complete len:347 (-),score=82.20 GFUD01099253.1:247-1287(-)
MGAEKFCLRWNDFETNLSSAFRDLRADNELFDVTLSCGADTLRAHKLVLSACSDLFRAMFRRAQPGSGQGHSILYLRGVHSADMQAVLDFMYHGEVSVAQEELNSFLSVAEDLKVKGLTQKQSDHSPPTKVQDHTERKVTEISNSSSYSNHEQKHSKPDFSSQNPPAPPKRPRPPKPSLPPPPQQEFQEIEEIVPVKTEPVSAPAYQQVATVDHIDTVEENAVDTYDGYAGYEDDGYQYQDHDGGQYTDGQVLDVSRGEDRTALLAYIQKESDSLGKNIYSCTLCGQSNSHRTNVMNHVESSHFPSLQKCDYCEKTFKSKNSKNVHISRNHREIHGHKESNYSNVF